MSNKYSLAIKTMNAAYPEIQERLDKTGMVRFPGSHLPEPAYFASRHRVYGNSNVLERLGYKMEPSTFDMVRYSDGNEVSRIKYEQIGDQSLWLLTGKFFFTVERWPKYYIDNEIVVAD